MANIQNEREKAEREMLEAQQQAQADADAETETETPEELQQQLDALNKAIADVTAKLHKGDVK